MRQESHSRNLESLLAVASPRSRLFALSIHRSYADCCQYCINIGRSSRGPKSFRSFRCTVMGAETCRICKTMTTASSVADDTHFRVPLVIRVRNSCANFVRAHEPPACALSSQITVPEIVCKSEGWRPPFLSHGCLLRWAL